MSNEKDELPPFTYRTQLDELREARAEIERLTGLMWFKLTGDARLGRCATEGCGGQPTERFEGGGIGSNYCSGCRARIDGERTPDTVQEKP